MKKIIHLIIVLFACTTVLAGGNKEEILATFKKGSPEIQSINALTFGEEGILFIGDSKSAKIFAIDTEENSKPEGEVKVEMSKVDEVIAASLGTSADQVTIQDMAVHPVSKTVYLAVSSSEGKPVLLKLGNGKFDMVSMDKIMYSEVSINDPIASDAEDRWGRPQRIWAISDLRFVDGKLYVSGLSNKEFGSTFRSISFPFTNEQKQSSLEIYHAAHGKFETWAPIKTFAMANVGGKKSLLASYTCTPLVVLPLDMIKEGEHVKGRTVAELGNWNTPLDMIVMEKDEKSYLLLSNSSRAVMKIAIRDIESFEGSLTEPVNEPAGTSGVDFINLPYVNVLQMDLLDEERFLMLQRKSNGSLDFVTGGNRWL